MKILFLTAIFSLCSCTSALAADVHIAHDTSFGEPIGRIIGEISKGDLESIEQVAKDLLINKGAKKVIFEIDSPGGDVIEAIKIGQLFRDLLVEVRAYGNIIRRSNSFIKNDLSANPGNEYLYFYDITKERGQDLDISEIRKCYSACVIIFVGAVERRIRDNHDQRNGRQNEIVTPIVGLHRPYFDKSYFGNLSPSEANKRYAKLTSSIRLYLSQMGVDKLLMDRMLKKSSSDMELVKKDDFIKHLNPTEPFLEEWLIAKCGEDNEKGALSPTELQKYTKLLQSQKAAVTKKFSHILRKKDFDVADFRNKVDAFYLTWAPDGYTQEEVRNLHRKVNKHSRDSRACRKTAIQNHQHNWASGNI